MGAETPRPLAVRPAGLPSELYAYDRWVAWRYKREDDKWAKKPVNCRTGRDTDAYDPKNWSTLDEALDYLQEHPDRIAGIGFVFDREEDALAGVDLDDCRNPETGELAPWASDIVKSLDTYTEVSPSGTGVKMILRGELPKGHLTTKAKDGGKIEMYTEKRYFALTGHHVAGTPEIIETRHEAFAALYRETFGGKFGIVQPRIEVFDEPPFHELTDDEIIEKASAADNGDKFKRLFFDGDLTGYDDDHSAADQALADILAFWCGPNSARVERLFGRSALAREDKWFSREDYRAGTTTKAIRRQMEADLFYRPTRCVLASAPFQLVTFPS